jgi:hypothetical protein
MQKPQKSQRFTMKSCDLTDHQQHHTAQTTMPRQHHPKAHPQISHKIVSPTPKTTRKNQANHFTN